MGGSNGRRNERPLGWNNALLSWLESENGIMSSRLVAKPSSLSPPSEIVWSVLLVHGTTCFDWNSITGKGCKSDDDAVKGLNVLHFLLIRLSDTFLPAIKYRSFLTFFFTFPEGWLNSMTRERVVVSDSMELSVYFIQTVEEAIYEVHTCLLLIKELLILWYPIHLPAWSIFRPGPINRKAYSEYSR